MSDDDLSYGFDGHPMQIIPGAGDWKPMMDPLKKVLQEIIKPQVENQTTQNKNQTQYHKEQIAQIEDIISKLSTSGLVAELTLKQLKDIDKTTKKEAEKNKTMREYLKDLATKTDKSGNRQHKIMNAIYTAGVVLKDIYNVSKKMMEAFNESNFFINEKVAEALRSNGVVIDNFDENFNKFANESGRTREEFTRALTENSRFVASQYAVGKDGGDILSKQLRKVSAKFGLTLEESEKMVKSFNDSMLTAGNQADIANINYENELEKSTKALKSFALATGQSVENILKEQKERERSWQMQKLATDPRTRNQLMMMRSAGLSDELIEGIMLGKHNKATVMAGLDPNSAAMLAQMRRSYMSTKGNPEAFANAMKRMSNSSAAEGMRRSQALVDPESLAYVNGLGELFDPASIWGTMTSMHMNQADLMDTLDAKAINETNKHIMTVNQINNDMVNALAPTLETVNEHLPWISKSVTAVPKGVAYLMNLPYISSIISGMATTMQIAEPIMDSKTMQMVVEKLSGEDVGKDDEGGGGKKGKGGGDSVNSSNRYFSKNGRGGFLLETIAGTVLLIGSSFVKDGFFKSSMVRMGGALTGGGIGGLIPGIGGKWTSMAGFGIGLFAPEIVDAFSSKNKSQGPAISGIRTPSSGNNYYAQPSQTSRDNEIKSLIRSEVVPLLRDIKDNSKNLYTEWRYRGTVGTNICTT